MTDYEIRLEKALEDKSKINDEIDFLRLQIKQEKKQAKWAKGSPVIKELMSQWPDARIDHGAGMTYVNLSFSVLDAPYEQRLPTPWEKIEERKVDRESVFSPILRAYRLKDSPVLIYATQTVR